MKKILVVIALIAGFLGAGWKRVVGPSESAIPPHKEVMKSDTSGVFIRTAVFGFNEEDTTVDNKDFKRIEIPGELIDQDTMRAGKPQIPFIRLLIAVPDSCDFNITVYESDYTLFEDYLIYPIPRIVFEETSGCFCSKEVYTYDTTFYQKDTLYPDKFYEVISDGHWRDQRVLEVFLYPVQFNPQQKLMYFYNGLDLRIEYSGEVVENENGLGPFEQIGREILLNYPGIDWEPESVPEPAVHYYTKLDTNNVADYIIVTHLDFINDGIALYWIDQFARWRVDHNKFDVGIVKMTDVYDEFLEHPPAEDDSAKALRDFLIYAYNNWYASSMPDNHFAYCLFIGDWDYVPTKLYTYLYGGEEWLGAVEGYFRNFGSGFGDEIMLGRWPVKQTNVQDLVTIAQKTISYESEPDTGDWRRRGLLIAGGDWESPYMELLFNYKVTQSTPYFTDIGYDTLTVRWYYIDNEDTFRVYIDNYLNHGEIITVYYDHGAPEGWWVHYDTSWVKDLENGARLPVVISDACFTAMFQWDHPFYDPHHSYPAGISLGEHFLINPEGGAIAFFGATTIAYMPLTMSTGQLCLKGLLQNQNWILGKSLVNLSAGYCLLGDPALDLGDYTAFPDLPDLVVRPRGIDISILLPHLYLSSGDTIPVRAKVWNIGAVAAYDVDVKFEVVCEEFLIYDTTVTIDTIQPRDTAVVTMYWDTGFTHPNYYGEIGDCEFTVTADPGNAIEESWEYNNESSITKKVAIYPNEPGWPKKVTDFTQPAIANLDGVGSVEIVYPSAGSVYVFDSEGNVVSPWPKYFDGVYGVVLGDIDDNGYIEIVAVSRDSIKVYNYQGTIMWQAEVPVDNYIFTGLPAVGYIDDMHLPEIVILATPIGVIEIFIKIFVYSHKGILQHEFTGSQSFQIVSEVEAILLNGASIEDVISGGNNEIVLSYGKEPSEFYTEIFDNTGSVAVLDYGSNRMTSALVDLDVPPDGYAEIITGSVDDTVRAYKATTGNTLWKTGTGGDINSSPGVGNINPLIGFDGNEIAFGNDFREIWAVRGIDGSEWLPWPLEVGGAVYTSPALANIDNDQGLDIIIGSRDRYIHAYTYAGNIISPYPLPVFGDLASGMTPMSAVIGDIDGDRKSENIFSSSDGYLHVWENRDSRVTSYSLEWPQFHHDHQRTGLYGW